MTIISALRTYMLTYNGLQTGAGLFVDHIPKEPTQYAIMPLPGVRILERYIDGGSRREFPFAIESMESTADDLERIQNSGFYEALADWLESQTLAGVFPSLGAGKTPEEIEAVGQPILLEFGESGTGIYQLPCRLVYAQQP